MQPGTIKALYSKSTYNLRDASFFTGLYLNMSKIASGKLPIPAHYGMIYRQLPNAGFSLSVNLKYPHIVRSATSDLTRSKAYL